MSSSNSDDDVVMNDDEFLEDSSDNEVFGHEEQDDDDDDDGSSSIEEHSIRFRSLQRHLEDDEDDEEEDETDFVDDYFHLDDHDMYAAPPVAQAYQPPMPWPPAIVAQQNQNQQLEYGSKPKKPGIIYLSSIPPGFNVTRTISFFSQFGKVGRVFLQPDLKEKAKHRDKLARNFTEGWVEFLSKRNAKEVAANLNTTQVGGSKRSKAHDVIWNIKYLPRFKWTHLSERLAYERASHTQKMRTEVSQAKREADFFRANVEKSKRIAKRAKQTETSTGHSDFHSSQLALKQREPDEAVRQSKRSESKSSRKKKKSSKHNPEDRKLDSGSKNTKRKKDPQVAKSEPSPKRARTRSSDRKEFLQSVFGNKT